MTAAAGAALAGLLIELVTRLTPMIEQWVKDGTVTVEQQAMLKAKVRDLHATMEAALNALAARRAK